MPYSYDLFKENIKKHFYQEVRINTKILDVGPGSGTYAKLLSPIGFKLDCVEIWKPYIEKYNLHSMYHNVYNTSILDFEFSSYDYIILGDVLEHIDASKAVELISRICSLNIKCLVAVPYLYEQDAYEDNDYEIHLQPDLTPELMKIRYPQLSLLFGDNQYGYYINYSISHKPFLKKMFSNIMFLIKKNFKSKGKG